LFWRNICRLLAKTDIFYTFVAFFDKNTMKEIIGEKKKYEGFPLIMRWIVQNF